MNLREVTALSQSSRLPALPASHSHQKPSSLTKPNTVSSASLDAQSPLKALPRRISAWVTSGRSIHGWTRCRRNFMGLLRHIGSVRNKLCSKRRSWRQALLQIPQHMETSPRFLLPPHHSSVSADSTPMPFQLHASDGTKEISHLGLSPLFKNLSSGK